jgi:sulfate-transporting ATPase
MTLHIEHVTVTFGGITAIADLSLDIGAGEVVGLIGPNGAGKTTMIDVISGFTPVDEGSITLDGRPIDRWSPRRRAAHGVARSFQTLELFEDMDVEDNIRAASDRRDVRAYLSDLVWPTRPALPTAAVSAIREFGLEHDLDRLPTELPYGRRRLVGIARAVAARPSILLLDEPAAGLEENESRELGAVVRRLADDWGIGVLLVEHDMSLVMAVCDRIVAIDFGRKLAEGAPDDVRRHEGVITAYLGGAADDLPMAESMLSSSGTHR